MSLKLCCALPMTLNCLKSSRTLFIAPNCVKVSRNGATQINLCGAIPLQYCRFSTEKDSVKADEKQDVAFKQIYQGPIASQVKIVKLFSVTTSVVGLTFQPILYKEIVAMGNVPIILAIYSVVGFFTVVTPLLLHIITKKYITKLFYNEETDMYVAETLNLFCATKKTEFKTDDITVPEIPGMFETFRIKGKPLFVDPRHFDNPKHYAKLMGYDKPMDFKLYQDSIADVTKTQGNSAPAASSSSSGSTNK